MTILYVCSDGRSYPLDPRVRTFQMTWKDDGPGHPIQKLQRPFYKWQACRKLIKAFRPDTVISFLLEMNLLNVLSGKDHRRICSERCNPVKVDGGRRFWLTKWIYRHADAVVFQSRMVRDLYDESVKAHSTVIPNPVGVGIRASEKRANRIVNLGRLTAQKNQALLIRSFAQFHRRFPDYTLTVYGEGDSLEALQALARELGVSQYVEFPGNRKDAHQQITDAEMFVLSSDYEGMSNALLECMDMGIACISTACEGSVDILSDGTNGLLVPVGDEDALTSAMCRLAGDEALRKRLEAQAVLDMEALSTERIVRRWEELILADGKSRSSRPASGADDAELRKVMVRLSGATKVYRLGQIGYGTLNRDLQSWWARKRHRPDPNLQIGMEQRMSGDTILALSGVDLTVYRGERVGIIGGNGAGKSTLLKLITRVTVPTSGSVDLYGRVTSMLEVGTGFHGEMTGRENIYLNGTILGMSRREIDEKLEQIIAFSEVGEFIDTPVKRYSSGMYVKLAFSVAAHLNSEIIIMDEVLAVGDEAFQQKCIQKMRETSDQEDRTILYVSHNMETVRALCDRVIVMADGKILFDGGTEEAVDFYRSYLAASRGRDAKIGAELRRDKKLSGLCRMTDIAVQSAEVPGGEDVRFRLCLSAARPLEGVGLRVMVNNGVGQMIGMTSSESFALAEGETWLDLRFPASCLAPDSYACDLALFSFDGSTQTRHDYLPKALRFRVEDRRLYFGSIWTPRKWGNVRLPEIRIGGRNDER